MTRLKKVVLFIKAHPYSIKQINPNTDGLMYIETELPTTSSPFPYFSGCCLGIQPIFSTKPLIQHGHPDEVLNNDILTIIASHLVIYMVKWTKKDGPAHEILKYNTQVDIQDKAKHTQIRGKALCPPSATVLTCVNESSRCPFAELFWLVGQCDFYNTRDVPGRSLHADGMRRNQLGKTVGRKLSLRYVKDSFHSLPISSQ